MKTIQTPPKPPQSLTSNHHHHHQQQHPRAKATTSLPGSATAPTWRSSSTRWPYLGTVSPIALFTWCWRSSLGCCFSSSSAPTSSCAAPRPTPSVKPAWRILSRPHAPSTQSTAPRADALRSLPLSTPRLTLPKTNAAHRITSPNVSWASPNITAEVAQILSLK